MAIKTFLQRRRARARLAPDALMECFARRSEPSCGFLSVRIDPVNLLFYLLAWSNRPPERKNVGPEYTEYVARVLKAGLIYSPCLEIGVGYGSSNHGGLIARGDSVCGSGPSCGKGC